jgi:hypothetical protein
MYVELHARSAFSFLTGASLPEALAYACVEHDGLKLSDGTVIPVGGKTGTGDNQFHIFGAKGGLLGTHAVNRTAAFAFFIGDRFFGNVLAFVPGKGAADYKFTSALAVQVLRDLAPALSPLIERTQSSMFGSVGVAEIESPRYAAQGRSAAR